MSAVLLARTATEAQITALTEAVKAIRGIHKVNVHRQVNVVDSEAQTSEWATIYYRGTEKALLTANGIVAILAAEDQNEDHDHARCIANARSMGVPPEWAHMPETYLSM